MREERAGTLIVMFFVALFLDVPCAEQADRIRRASADRRRKPSLDRRHEARQCWADYVNVYIGRRRLQS
jgi:hypothetical protein